MLLVWRQATRYIRQVIMRQYYVLNMDPRAREVCNWIFRNNIRFEVHLNRTRFWVPSGAVLTEFLLRFSLCCPRVDESVDLATGLPINTQ
jgi:hypothetical protein